MFRIIRTSCSQNSFPCPLCRLIKVLAYFLNEYVRWCTKVMLLFYMSQCVRLRAVNRVPFENYQCTASKQVAGKQHNDSLNNTDLMLNRKMYKCIKIYEFFSISSWAKAGYSVCSCCPWFWKPVSDSHWYVLQCTDIAWEKCKHNIKLTCTHNSYASCNYACTHMYIQMNKWPCVENAEHHIFQTKHFLNWHVAH